MDSAWIHRTDAVNRRVDNLGWRLAPPHSFGDDRADLGVTDQSFERCGRTGSGWAVAGHPGFLTSGAKWQ